jgi:hypothetical protein
VLLRGDVDGTASLLATDLSFAGTLHFYRSAAEYLDDLRRDPPEPSVFRVVSVTESSDSVPVFYEYEKTKRTVRIAQLFTLESQRTKRIPLVFDGRGFD